MLSYNKLYRLFYVYVVYYLVEIDKRENGGHIMVDQQKIEMFIVTNKKFFPEEKIVQLRDTIRSMNDDKFLLATSVEFKDPTTLLLVSLFLGVLGIDRFMLGENGMGILKLLTCGCCGILTIIDWFTIMKKTKDYNYNKLMSLV